MLHPVTAFLDEYLGIHAIADHPNALNGLQLENNGEISRIGAAVDASEAVISMAIERQIDFLLVHHGIFWGGLARIAGPMFRKISVAVQNNLAIYAAHLPLDVHPELGNNVLFARALGITQLRPFLAERGLAVGCRGLSSVGREELLKRIEGETGYRPWVCPAGPATIQKVGVVTGAGGNLLSQAAREDVDTFITGEGPHHTFALAEELHLNLIYAGHYATETYGVRALALKVAKKFRLVAEFLDRPSGL
jgi:dinuclear metal center YbgI/SA1388 family protein